MTLDSSPFPHLGFREDRGLWIIPGWQADELSLGASVIHTDDIDRGDRWEIGAQNKTELGWAGPPEFDVKLDPTAMYCVLWPLGHDRGRWPAMSYREFEAARDSAQDATDPHGIPAVVTRVHSPATPGVFGPDGANL